MSWGARFLFFVSGGPSRIGPGVGPRAPKKPFSVKGGAKLIVPVPLPIRLSVWFRYERDRSDMADCRVERPVTTYVNLISSW